MPGLQAKGLICDDYLSKSSNDGLPAVLCRYSNLCQPVFLLSHWQQVARIFTWSP